MFRPQYVDYREALVLVAERVSLPKDRANPLNAALSEGQIRVEQKVDGMWERGSWASLDVWLPHPLADSRPQEGQTSCYDIRLRTDDLDRLWPPEAAPAGAPTVKMKAGAPSKADWPALEDRFREEVGKRGKPDPLNEKGWQSQADVARWLMDLAAREGDKIGFDVAKKRARSFVNRLENAE